MKKGQIVEGIVQRMDFPNKGIVETQDGDVCIVKNALPGQKVKCLINKVRKGKAEGRLLDVLEPSPVETGSPCPHFGECGGCLYLSFPYEEQLKIKEMQVKKLLDQVLCRQENYEFEGIKASPVCYGYRNKMEFSFGDEIKDGPLSLGMHKRGSFYDIVYVKDCQIVDEDYRKILSCVREYFHRLREDGVDVSFYHRLRHVGYLRHLLVRKAAGTGEILIALITTTQEPGRLNCGEVDKENVKLEKIEMDAPINIHESVQPEVRIGRQEKIEMDAPMNIHESVQPEVRIDRQTDGDIAEESLETQMLDGFKKALLELSLDGKIAGILHTKNDSLADVVQSDETEILYGKDYFYEELLGLKFKISQFSFFQTNSRGAEVLYQTARDYISDYIKTSQNENEQPGTKSIQLVNEQPETKSIQLVNKQSGTKSIQLVNEHPENESGQSGKIVFDLYSGTGTIAQLMASVAKKVIGVEIVEEAVEAARKNAELNGLHNCKFVTGDVLKVIDNIEEKPDIIILDPPRDGIHPKALDKIIRYGVEHILYISCKPTSLVRDLEVFLERGYRVKRAVAVDQFPWTGNVETVCLLSKLNGEHHIEVEINLDEMDLTAAESKATYEEIKDYVREHTGLKVSSLYIAQIKEKCGIIEKANYNLPKLEDSIQPKCPPGKEVAIMEALRHFRMI